MATLFDKKFFCCERMVSHLYIPSLHLIFDDGDWEDKMVHYIPRFDEYGIPLPDGSSSMITIQFCPWCGKKLPQSKRNDWFDAIEKLGCSLADDRIPEEYLSEKWWAGKISK